MHLNTVAARTPYYVLIDGDLRIGPNVMPPDNGTACSPIYGFSDKPAYDKFRAEYLRALKPYPLVKGYLRNEIDAASGSLKLVVMDAVGPREAHLNAATIEAVFEAHENRLSRVCAEYQLKFDDDANAYRVEHD